MSPQIRKKIVPVNRNMAAIAEAQAEQEEKDDKPGYADRKRQKYAMMRQHKEAAAVVLAAGGSYEMAANQAGVSERQVRKYVSDSDFRARVDELRELLMGRVKGRIQKEFERRTDPERIKHLEIMDLARIYDRTTGSETGAASGEGEHNYDRILQQIIITNSGPESSDFPEYGDEDFSVSEPSPQEPKQVSPGGRGEADREVGSGG
jgi:hypothetical protein